MQTIIPLNKLLGLYIQQGHFPKKLILSYSFPNQKLNSWLAQFTSFVLFSPYFCLYFCSNDSRNHEKVITLTI